MKSRTFPDAKVDARKAKPTVRKNHDEQHCSKKHQENQHLFAHHPVFESGKTKNNVLYRTSASAFDETFSKLDPNDEVHSNRIQQRRKQILMGKNTVGYECYIQRIPKSNRKLRSMDTPSTPDHTLDIPAKRWTGLVKAWYVLDFCTRDLVCWHTTIVKSDRFCFLHFVHIGELHYTNLIHLIL